MRGNDTRNQHFVSQVEQKLNALNPCSRNRKYRIYSFRITDRENYKIELESPRGHLVSSTLSLLDLFSFDIPDGSRVRMNLEGLFHKYERNVEVHTKALIEKLLRGNNDIEAELIELFAAKLLNFARNPFCIAKVLNSFPGMAAHEPTDPDLLATYRKIVTGQKPHQASLCRVLGVSHDTYIEWLKLLFMLLIPLGSGQPNLFEGVILSLFENRNTHKAAFVSIYDQDYCLLSDRGLCQPVQSGPKMTGWSFNLCATASVDYIFADAADLVKGRASPEYLEYALANQRKLPASINVTVQRNDRDALTRYNRHVIEWSRERVYCAVKAGIVIS
jgi:hypothetical protein